MDKKWEKILNTCRVCGATEDIHFSLCPKCTKERDLKEVWKNPGRYILVAMHKKEYERFYKYNEMYDTKPYSLDPDYVYVYIDADKYECAKRNHKIFESEQEINHE